MPVYLFYLDFAVLLFACQTSTCIINKIKKKQVWMGSMDSFFHDDINFLVRIREMLPENQLEFTCGHQLVFLDSDWIFRRPGNC